jgi:ABC-2 type transport system ATP-binding protein
MADRVGVINKGEIVVVEEKAKLMRQLGKKQMTLELHEPLQTIPAELAHYPLELASKGMALVYTYDTQVERTGITTLLGELKRAGIPFKDLHTKQSSLEEIFVSLVRRQQ